MFRAWWTQLLLVLHAAHIISFYDRLPLSVLGSSACLWLLWRGHWYRAIPLSAATWLAWWRYG